MDTATQPIERGAWLTLLLASTVVFMVSVELSIIALALPEIRGAFPDASEATISWIITSYNIAVASLLLVAGWLADRFGRRRFFMIGVAVFAVGSLLSGLAPNAASLIAFRTLQAIGGALQFPSGLALLLTAWPRSRHQMAIGIWGAMGALAAALGPTLGAVLVDGFGWRAVFLVNVPVAVAAFILAPRWLAESTGEGVAKRVDVLAVPLASVGVGAAILAITQGSSWGWTSGATLGTFAFSAALVAAFILRSRAHPRPLFDLGLFRIGSFARGNIATVFFMLAYFGYAIPMPTYIQSVWGWSVIRTGLAVAPGPLLAMFVSPTAGRLADRIGNAPILVVGGTSGFAGMIWLTQSIETTPNYLTGLLFPSLLIGLAAGFGFAQLVGDTMRDVPPRQYAMAGAGRTTVFQLAVALAIAGAFAIIGRPSDPTAALASFRAVWWVAAGCFAAVAVIYAASLAQDDVIVS
ncbi:MAG: DHA2 family efflux MFS transporter permease subunit [Acidimicrobiales bacterium]